MDTIVCDVDENLCRRSQLRRNKNQINNTWYTASAYGTWITENDMFTLSPSLPLRRTFSFTL